MIERNLKCIGKKVAVVHSVKYKESHIFAYFPMLTTLYILGLKVLGHFRGFC